MSTALAIDSLFDASRRRELTVTPGSSLADMVTAAFPGLADRSVVRVTLGGDVIAAGLWHLVRPKRGTTVVLRVIPQGDTLRNVLTIAVTVGAIALGQFYAPALAGALGISEGLASGVIQGTALVAGTLLVNALVPPAKQDDGSPSYSANGFQNHAKPNGQIPLVLGRIRIAPPYAALPYTEGEGDDQYVVAAFLGGYGPLAFSDFRIGDTPIGKFDDCQVETRGGYPDDDPLSVYPRQVLQVNQNVELTLADGDVERYTAANCTVGGFDLTFPGGIVSIDKKGEKNALTVTFFVRYRLAGTANWTTIDIGGVTSDDTTPVVRSFFINFPTRGRYEIAINRTSEDWDDEDQSKKDEQKTARSFLTAIRSIRPEYPIDFPKPLALIGARIRASRQLNGTLDTLNCIAETVCSDWDAATGKFVLRATNNPASLFRYVLMGPAIRYPLSDAEVDALTQWHGFCKARGLTYNRVHDFEASVFDVLTDIAAAGRASPQDSGETWGVIIDNMPDLVSAHITPRNSWGFQGERKYAVLPDAFRVSFADQSNGYQQAERIVPRPGFAGDPIVFEALSLPGRTNPDQVWRDAIYHWLQIERRPDTYTVNQDMEALQVGRGDHVQVSHDVLDHTMVAARVTSVDDDLGFVTLDEVVTMVSGTSYAARFRSADGDSILRTIKTMPGDTQMLQVTGSGDLPAVGDLAMFGTAGTETLACLVTGVEAMENFTARLTLKDLAPEIGDIVDNEVPPPWSGIAGGEVNAPQQGPVAPVIVSITSGVAAAGSISTTVPYPVVVLLKPGPGNPVPLASYTVQSRRAGAMAWATTSVQAGSGAAILDGYAKGDAIEVRAQAVSIYGLGGPQSTITTHTVGASDPAAPKAPTGFTAVKSGTTGKLAWTAGASKDNTATQILRASGATATIDDADLIGDPIYSGPNAALTYNDTGLAAGTYRYWVVALDDSSPPVPSAATGPADITI